MFESDLEDISRHFRRSVPENNATEYAIPFRAVPWNNALLKIKSNHHSESSQCREDLTPHGE